MSIILSGSTNDILVNGVSVATDAEVSSAVTSGVAPKANTVDLKEIGVGQTWQDVTASRVLGTTYTNSTGKPIMVAVQGNSAGAFHNLVLLVDGTTISHLQHYVSGGSGSHITVTTIIPTGSTYSVANYQSTGIIWKELR